MPAVAPSLLREACTRRFGLLISRLLVGVWAAFWIWFAGAVGISEALQGTPVSLAWAATFILPLLVLAALPWRWPCAAGILLVIAGLGAGWYLPHPFTRLAMALPAALLGVALVGLAGRTPGDQAGRMPR